MSVWTLATIRTLTRRVSGKFSPNQMIDADVNAAINNFYTRRLPKKINSSLFDGWFTAITTPNNDTIAVSTKYLELRAPFTINGHLHVLKEDPGLFYHRWPQSQDYGPSESYDCLLFNNTLILRPVPDAEYPIQAAALIAPDPMESDSTIPLNEDWGELIAYGAGIMILLQSGNYDAAAAASEVFRDLVGDEEATFLLQLGTQRSVPRF